MLPRHLWVARHRHLPLLNLELANMRVSLYVSFHELIKWLIQVTQLIITMGMLALVTKLAISRFLEMLAHLNLVGIGVCDSDHRGLLNPQMVVL